MANLDEMWQLAQGALMEPDATWAKAKAQGRSARQMAQSLTIPLVLLSAVVSLVLGLVFSRNQSIPVILGHSAVSATLGILGVFLLAFLADYLAGYFGGGRDYNAAFNAVALCGVPSAIGAAILPIPVVGGLGSLGLGLYGLYLFYRALPVFLTIPAEKRLAHYLATLGAGMLAGIIVSMVFRG